MELKAVLAGNNGTALTQQRCECQADPLFAPAWPYIIIVEITLF